MKVTAAARPEPGEFTITLRFINQPTATQELRFTEARTEWEAIISGDLADVTGIIPARTCGSSFKTPLFNGTIDDLLIDVLLQPIDGPGAILGAAGPCLVRSSDFLSLYGIMFFDTADLDFLEDLGFFDEVVKHEMGHVLGFGTLWSFGHDLLEGAGTADPRFTGPLAIAAYDRLGGTGTVPVEGDQGGAGTRDSHWDEATFFNELMTGFLNASADVNPLSDLSVAAMGDLGYVVNLGSGERYRLPGPSNSVAAISAKVAGQARGLDLARQERLIRPVATVD
jgi:hypothetical protein